MLSSPKAIRRFIVAKGALFCHKRHLHRPAEKGCRGDGDAGFLAFAKTLAISTL
jgi:hypothetical protein